MSGLPVRPKSVEELAGAIANAAQAGTQVRVTGSGSMPLSRFEEGGGRLVQDISMLRLNKIVEHAVADMTVTVGAGITLEALQRELAWRNQWLPVDAPAVCEGPRRPGGRTIGGMIATNSLGPLREMEAGTNDWRRLVLGMTWIDGGGRVVKGGGRTMKNAAGYQTQRMMIGACGTLGAIAEVTLRTAARPEEEGAVTFYCDAAAQAAALVAAVRLAPVTPAYVQACAGATFGANPLGLPAGGGVVVTVGFLDRRAGGEGWRAQVERVRELREAEGIESISHGAAQAGRLRLWMASEPAAEAKQVGFRVHCMSSEVCGLVERLGQSEGSWVVAEAGAGVVRGVAGAEFFARILKEARGADVVLTQGAPGGETARGGAIFAAVKAALDPRGVFGKLA
jgi:FAD/FMN-containing dehydrogenase